MKIAYKQLNESTVKLFSSIDGELRRLDNQIRKEIDTFFAKFHEGYYYIPSYTNGVWDGKTHFYDVKLDILPLGLLSDLKDKFKNIIDLDASIDLPSEKINCDFETFYKTLNLKDGYDIRDYQQKGFELPFLQGKTILQAATGAGKSLIIWLINKYATEVLKHDVLVIVPQVMLVEQLSADFTDYGSFKDGIEYGKSTTKDLNKTTAKKLGLDYDSIATKKELNLDLNKQIVIATWQTLQHKDKAYFERFQTIIMDEVHLLDGEVIQSILQSCKNAKIRVGLTGTLKQDPKSKMMYKSIFHNENLLITSRELIDRGFAAEVIVQPITLKYPNKPKYFKLQDEVNYIKSHEERLEFIQSLIKKLLAKEGNNNTLVLFKSVANGFWVELEEFCKQFANKVYVIHGSKTAVERETARLEAEMGSGVVILASFATFATGVNIKRIHNIIFTESYASMSKVVQAIGRGMRLHEGKNKIFIFDINDRFQIANHTYKQFKKRCIIYKDFEYKVNPTIERVMKTM